MAVGSLVLSQGSEGWWRQPRGVAAATGSLMLAAALYCLTHGWLQEGGASLSVSLRWAVASVLPWGLAWLVATRWVPASGQVWALGVAGLCLTALLLSAAGRTLLFPGVVEVGLESFAYGLHRGLPMAGLVALGLWALGRRQEGRAEVPRTMAALAVGEARREPVADALRDDGLADLRHPAGTGPLRAADVERVVAAGNYVELRVGQKTVLWRRPLKEVEALLAPHGFVRVHRSVLVRRDRVRAVEGSPSGALSLTLADGERLPVGRQFREAVRGLRGAA